MDDTEFDVLIIGAGLSGINAAYRIQDGLPGYSYAILEARDDLGGTWSFFKYPGIRSDSDLFTFGFDWDPWVEGEFLPCFTDCLPSRKMKIASCLLYAFSPLDTTM